MALDRSARGRRRALRYFAGAAVLASLAIGLLVKTISAYENAIESASHLGERVVVVFAHRDLYPGLPIVEEDLVSVEIDPAFLPGHTAAGLATSLQQVVGRVPESRILAREPVRELRLSDAAAHRGINGLIPSGQRAVSLSIGDGAALEGLLAPGSFVDVMAQLTSEGAKMSRTRFIAYRVPVLGVNGHSEYSGDVAELPHKRRRKSTVTLLVDPLEAERIVHADQAGKVVLTARAPEDTGVAPISFGVPGEDTDVQAPGVLVPTAPEPIEEPVIDVINTVLICRGTECRDQILEDTGAL